MYDSIVSGGKIVHNIARGLKSNDAVKGGELTQVETLCDRAVADLIADSSLVSFGVETLVAFLAGFEEDLASVRMIMSMKLVGMEPARIRERLVTRL